MAHDVIMPQMGESIAEGTVTKWLKQVGDTVERDEPLFEISTDKVDAEIPSPASGVVVEIRGKEGDTVDVNAVVAVIETDGAAEASAGSETATSTAEPAIAPAAAPTPTPMVRSSSVVSPTDTRWMARSALIRADFRASASHCR